MTIKTNRILFFAILLLVSVGGFAQGTTQNLSVAGLKENVIVRRDERGIPYIEAKSEADLYFAQGFTTAQDRLWQMDLYRRVARGETAELFGKLTLDEDKRWRKFGFSIIAEDNLKNSAPEVRAALENFSRGVNAFIATLDEKSLPSEFQIFKYRPAFWKPTDSIMIGYILADALSTTWEQDLLKSSLADLSPDKLEMFFNPISQDDVLLFGKDVAKAKSMVADSKLQIPNSNSTLDLIAKENQIRKNSLERIGFYAEFLAASNNWVISGKRTADGKPILANDPHLRPSQPPIWYLVNLSAPNVHVSGVTFPGSPGVVLGHNENIAWGATNVGPDVQDLYLETFDAKDSLKYKTPSGWETATVRREEIKVRKSAVAAETETEILEVVTTRNGVIFAEDSGKKYALKWTMFDAKQTTFDAFHFINRAKNWDEYKNALKRYGGAMQNFVYADVQGNIGWYAAGKIPIRRSGDGSTVYDGAKSDGDWTGFIPFMELPNLYNPPNGFIVTANQRIVGTSYKYHDFISRIFVPYRAKRIENLINANPKMTMDATSDIQMDIFSILNERFAREIVKEKAASGETLRLFEGWDGRMSADSKAALVADEIRIAFRNRILKNAVGEDRAKKMRWANEGNFINKILAQKPKNWLPKEFANYADLLKVSEKDALENLKKRLGANEAKWTWGEAYKIRFSHPLVGVPFIGAQFAVPVLPSQGSGGLAATPNVGASVSMRFIASPGNWDATRHVITTGESGNPNSPNWADQLQMWYRGQTPIFPFSTSAVEKAAKQIVVLMPK